MSIAVALEPAARAGVTVEYRWDPDTDILSARCEAAANGDGASGSVELAGGDGSWLILDLAGGAISGVEVAVWPDVQTRPALSPPRQASEGALRLRDPRADEPLASIEVHTSLAAEADGDGRTVHFRIGEAPVQRAVQVARDFLIELDAADALAGVWLLNVPPFPSKP